MFKRLTFIGGRELPTTRDGTDYLFSFTVVDTSLIGLPEEKSSTTSHSIKVGISGRMEAAWHARQSQIDFMKVCYEYGRRELVQKIKDGSIEKNNSLEITSSTYPDNCPFDSTKIHNQLNSYTDIEVMEILMEDITLLQLATSIIEYRDFINALFKEKHRQKLFQYSEERDILQLFRPANSLEEFTYRISALNLLMSNINQKCLIEICGVEKEDNKSISILEQYLKSFKSFNDKPIKTYRSINRLRQLYPIHGDNIDGVQKAHNYFHIQYPISNPSEAWQKILISYRDALFCILEIIKS